MVGPARPYAVQPPASDPRVFEKGLKRYLGLAAKGNK